MSAPNRPLSAEQVFKRFVSVPVTVKIAISPSGTYQVDRPTNSTPNVLYYSARLFSAMRSYPTLDFAGYQVEYGVGRRSNDETDVYVTVFQLGSSRSQQLMESSNSHSTAPLSPFLAATGRDRPLRLGKQSQNSCADSRLRIRSKTLQRRLWHGRLT